GDITIRADQYGCWRRDFADHRKLPFAGVFCFDDLDPVRPGRDIAAPQHPEVEQHRPGLVKKTEYAPLTVWSTDLEIGHSSPQKRMSFAQFVAYVQAGHH